jgi:NAD(P)-dependent dehydrogenase (short-subunit alcohol dehydrogenase family)
MISTKEFNNKVVMITGANRGIGKSLADYFYARGAIIVLGVRHPSTTEVTYDSARCLVYELDVRNEKQLLGFYTSTIERFGKIDVLINNAGVDKPCGLLDIELEYLHDMMSVNFYSMVLLTKLVASNMIQNRFGRVINISSIAGKEGTPHHIAYASSKHAVIGFTKCAARELIKYNITVNSVCPGLIKTDMLENFFEEYSSQTGSAKDQELSLILDKTPRGVIGRPEDVAHLVGFLCLEGSINIVGQAINTDGGLLQW